ncbi:hypothetical protein CHARACLAT_033584 [Characodon lateralis]|uniref:Uncharacterized protein n=1 Tax=Characodon lateralis TaxID=208331 RepID=A0ABU7ESV1_9TELE|nr:hypothetical protein [Characodon lateralis]
MTIKILEFRNCSSELLEEPPKPLRNIWTERLTKEKLEPLINDLCVHRAHMLSICFHTAGSSLWMQEDAMMNVMVQWLQNLLSSFTQEDLKLCRSPYHEDVHLNMQQLKTGSQRGSGDEHLSAPLEASRNQLDFYSCIYLIVIVFQRLLALVPSGLVMLNFWLVQVLIPKSRFYPQSRQMKLIQSR